MPYNRMKKEGLFMLKKGVLLAVSLMLFTVFNLILLAAPAYADTACCTNPEVSENYFCNDFSYDTSEDKTDVLNNCCFGIEECRSQYIWKEPCSSRDECTEGSVVGCCVDECRSGTLAQCKNKELDNFKTVSCDNIASCSTGCCLCTQAPPPLGTGEPTLAFNLITEPECLSDCKDRGFEYYDFNPQQADCGNQDKATGIKVSGKVTNDLLKPLEKATVIIPGFGQVETGSGGEFEISDVPQGQLNRPRQYIIKVIKSEYVTNVTTINISSTDTEKIINFELNKAKFAILSGKITDDTTSLNKIPNAAIKISGTDNTYLSDKDGNYELIFHLLSGGNRYDIEASAQGYFSKTEKDIELTGDVNLDFHLAQKKKGVLKVKVLDSRSNQCEPELQSGLQRFTDLNCEVIFGEGKKSDDIYEGNYTITIFKPLFLTNLTTLFEVHPNYGGDSADVLTVYLVHDNDMCYLPADSDRGIQEEYIRNASCSQLNKPYYCKNGDLELVQTNPQDPEGNNLVSDRCQGKDGIARTADDCCASGEECQDNGFCLPLNEECTSTCTFNNDLTCHAACNGIQGCSFYNAEVMKACDDHTAYLLEKL
ncbi:carboxypeptidase-like regulatory domain-containing protein [Candidatus Woesearchaeota archaeon]|nr:carboxypeptidase-like regulatory domain-containing protein [Candidatus Woesearchaeota archaeon]